MNFSAAPGATSIFVLTIAASLLGLLAAPKIIERSLFRPYWFLRARQYDTIYMSGFVHADFGHLAFNMFTYWFFAFPLEARIGTVPFVVLYILGLVLSHTCTYFKHRNDEHYASLGASGAIAGVLFAFIVYFPNVNIYVMLIPIPIPAVFFAIAYVAYSYIAGRQARGRINHDAHFCGALSGLLFVAVYEPSAWNNVLQAIG